MDRDTDAIVFTRPTRRTDRLVFSVTGAAAIAFAVMMLWPDHNIHPSQPDAGVLSMAGTALFFGIGMYAVAWFGGTTTVTIDRRSRRLEEIVSIGPLTAFRKLAPFKDLGEPFISEDRSRTATPFILVIPVKGRTEVEIRAYASRAQAAEMLPSIRAAISDVDLPRSEVPIEDWLDAEARLAALQAPAGRPVSRRSSRPPHPLSLFQAAAETIGSSTARTTTQESPHHGRANDPPRAAGPGGAVEQGAVDQDHQHGGDAGGGYLGVQCRGSR
jgi:hypothetical protein